jgi:tRNA (cytidine/uridine-2'-O-)-methyltransferase
MQPRFDDNVTPMHYNPRLHIVLFEPEIPHNAGSVGRTCVAVGAKLWLVRPFGFRLDDHHLKRAGLDYWQHLEWEAVDNWSALLEKLPPTRRWLFSKRAKHPYYETQFQEGDVLVFGNESQGLPEAMLKRPVTKHYEFRFENRYVASTFPTRLPSSATKHFGSGRSNRRIKLPTEDTSVQDSRAMQWSFFTDP